MTVSAAETAASVALIARRAMVELRNSDLPGGRMYLAADDAVQAIDGVVAEARRMVEAGR